MSPTIRSFQVTRPPYEITQERSLEVLARAHSPADPGTMERTIRRVACGPDRIARRGHCIPDLDATVRDVARDPWSNGSEMRTRMFTREVDRYMQGAYADEDPPDDLIQVTCTGYVSPSAAQKLVAARGWSTRVTHAYHMGCYASIPALRIAAGALATGSRRVDIAHTEMCSLHVDPREHGLEQLVVQSLFADGFIRYTVAPSGPGLRVLAIHEQLIPDSAHAMSWAVGDRGMQMTLSRDVPSLVASHVRRFAAELFARANVDLERLRESVVAVHPGGPKIIDLVADVLELAPAQIAESRAVLRDYGNMSSATLPHIWERMLIDPSVAPGTLIPSFAFGPGLTICGALLETQ